MRPPTPFEACFLVKPVPVPALLRLDEHVLLFIDESVSSAMACDDTSDRLVLSLIHI